MMQTIFAKDYELSNLREDGYLALIVTTPEHYAVGLHDKVYIQRESEYISMQNQPDISEASLVLRKIHPEDSMKEILVFKLSDQRSKTYRRVTLAFFYTLKLGTVSRIPTPTPQSQTQSPRWYKYATVQIAKYLIQQQRIAGWGKW